MTAEAQSLVEWVNSLGEGTCKSLRDLSPGTLLFKCIQNVIPTLSSGGEGEWSALLVVLTEFCGCSLEQSVSIELIEEGDEEHIARAVVLLLCLAVQRKPNEDIISRITTLSYKAQCDIMYFIEEVLAKMKSNALSSGLFTSGVGDVVPALSERGDEMVVGEEENLTLVGEGNEQDCGKRDDGVDPGCQVEYPPPGGCGPVPCDSTPQPTPSRHRRPSNRFICPTSIPRSLSRHKISRTYYQGLESPAAVQWMQSQRPAHQSSEGPVLPEELLKLQHKVRVLEKSLHSEQTLSQEMHAALCLREQEYCELEANYQKAQATADKVKELIDMQDELQTMAATLEKSEKNSQRLQREMEDVRVSQEQEMEQKVSEIGHLKTENEQLKKLLETSVADQLEVKSEVKRLQLSSETAAISFQAKERECGSLLQLNQEQSSEIRELQQQLALLQQELTKLKEINDDKVKILTEENTKISIRMTQAQEQLGARQEEYDTLLKECKSLREQVTVAEAGSRTVMEQYQTTVEEMEVLRTHCKMVEGQLGETKTQLEEIQAKLSTRDEVMSHLEQTTGEQLQHLQAQLERKETELASLNSHLTELKDAADEEYCETQKQLAEKEAECLNLQQNLSEQTRKFEEALYDTQQQLNSLRERYTIESEEMAAVKASLEEDLVRIQSEFQESQRELSEKECRLVEREREVERRHSENEALKAALDRLHVMVGELDREKAEIRDQRTRVENQLQELTAEIEEKECEWLAEKQILENKVVELSSELEMVTKETLCMAEDRHKTEQAKWAEEKQGWLVQTALLEDQVTSLTEEIETATAITQQREREVNELRESLSRAQSTMETLQAEVTAKGSEVAALEHTLREAQVESGRLREERERREETLTGAIESLKQQLEEVEREKEQAQKELEQLTQESKDSFAKMETKYQNTLAEMEKGHQFYCTELTALREANSHLQQQQVEANAENTAILHKQTELYKELSALQETKNEIMDLCRQYEDAYNKERERRQADQEQIRKMRTQSFSESESAATEVNSLRKQLSGEKRSTTRLSAENRSLKAQLSFLEQKLKDLEQERYLSSSPRPSQKGLSSTYIAPPKPSSNIQSTYMYDSQTNTEDFYSQLQHEFDSSTNTQIPTDVPDTTFKVDTYESSVLNSRFHSTAITEVPPSLPYATRSSVSRMSQLSDKDRISELKDRNSRVLPHLKSSYAVEFQEKPESPHILNERINRPRRKRPVGNDSVRLTSTGIAGGHVAEDFLVGGDTRKRTTTTRKVTGDLSFTGSPVHTRRRISEPETPSDGHSDAGSKWQDPRRATMAGGYPLRDREDEPEIENKPATMFELNFSPPSIKPASSDMPERLKQRLTKKERPARPAAVPPQTSTARDGTKKTTTAGKRSQPTTKRYVLKSKN